MRRPARKLTVISDGQAFERPTKRGDCANGPRPCPWVGCSHHLALARTDIRGQFASETHAMLAALKQVELAVELPSWESEDNETCALDLIDRNGPMSGDEVAQELNCSFERVRQIEERVVNNLRSRCKPSDFLRSTDEEEQVDALKDAALSMAEDGVREGRTWEEREEDLRQLGFSFFRTELD